MRFGVPEDVGFGFPDQAGPEQGKRLRGAVADPGAVVISRARFEGKSSRVHENKRRLRLDRVADFTVADNDLARADLFPPDSGDSLASGAKISCPCAMLIPSRIGDDEHECDAVSGREGK